MLDLLKIIILFIMGAQFGIALAASIVVHPSLLVVSRSSAIEIFRPFFKKTHTTVLTLSVIVSLIALLVSTMTGNWWWFLISLIMHLNGPYTFFLMMPLNRRLMADDVDIASTQTIEDLRFWGKLHAIRTLMNGIVFLIFIVLIAK